MCPGLATCTSPPRGIERALGCLGVGLLKEATNYICTGSDYVAQRLRYCLGIPTSPITRRIQLLSLGPTKGSGLSPTTGCSSFNLAEVLASALTSLVPPS